jgi:hypothetical protein
MTIFTVPAGMFNLLKDLCSTSRQTALKIHNAEQCRRRFHDAGKGGTLGK